MIYSISKRRVLQGPFPVPGRSRGSRRRPPSYGADAREARRSARGDRGARSCAQWPARHTTGTTGTTAKLINPLVNYITYDVRA
jgi:hypothetical protein